MTDHNIKLDFVIIGGQKCGSTYLQTVINKHPEVNMAPGEVPFLEIADFKNSGLEKLKERLSNLNHNKLVGIKRPNYLVKPEVLDRMLAINNNVKVIVILRNPVDRLKSAYFHYMNDGFCPVLELNKGVNLILNGKLENKYKRTHELLEFGFYSEHIKRYQNHIKDNLLVLFYDDLKENRLGVIKKCYSFLGVDSTYIPEESFLNQRPQKVNYSLFRSWFLSKRNNYRYTYNEDKTRLTLKDQTKRDELICKWIDKIDNRIIKRFFWDDKKPTFEIELKHKLISIYQNDIKELEKMFDRDLSNWLK